MQVVRVHQPGGPEALLLEDLPLPTPGPGEVRVKATVLGVGRPDVLIRRGTYKWMPPLPAVPGAEMVGVVDALGEGVPAAWRGRRVLVSARELSQRGGGYAEAWCVPVDALFELPDAVDDGAAACLPNLQLALALLRCAGGATPRSVLVPGVCGGVGSALAQVALAQGVRVIGTARGAAKQALARELDVTELAAADAATLAAEVMALTGGEGVDACFDHLGGDWLLAGLHALAPFGTLVSYNLTLGPPPRDTLLELRSLLGRSLGLRTFSMHTYDHRPAERRALMAEAMALVAAGRIRLPEVMRLPLAQVRQAHTLLEAGDVPGKLVLVP